MKKNFTLLLILLLSSCKLAETYKPGGFGSVNGGTGGNTSSLVTISGRVMSTATYNSSSGSFLGLMVRNNYVRQSSERDTWLMNKVVPYGATCASTDPCKSATWSLQYLGSTTVVATGTSDCGDFTIPSVPDGNEGVVTFTCQGNKSQRCIVKAGDTGLNCNAIADAVADTVEAAVAGSMLDPAMAGKILAKVATAIVETTNNDNTESEELKTAIDICKSISSDTNRKACYKNALLSSTQSSTLNVVKTLVQTWNVRNLLNFIVVTLNYQLSFDNFIFSRLGTEIDNWASSDFIAKTREVVIDLVNNPDYIGGDPNNGEQVAKIECKIWYNKFQSGGEAIFRPTLVTNNDGLQEPSCLNKKEIALLTGLNESDTKIANYFTALASAQGDWKYQIGNAKDINNNPLPCNNSISWNTSDSFCLSKPELKFSSRLVEPDRNDLSGENNRFSPERRAGLIEASDLIMAKLLEIENLSKVAGPLFGCINMSNNGPPTIDFANINCSNKLKTEMSKLRNEFGGIGGLYNYLNYPDRYASSGSSKLSLSDIHKAFSRIDFSSSQLINVTRDSYYSRSVNTGTMNLTNWVSPTVEFSIGIPFLSNIFKPSANNFTNSSIDTTTFFSIVENGKLSNKYNLTFKMFEKIPILTDIQASIQSASHHENFNPFGAKYTNAVARKKPKDSLGNVDYSAKDFPVFCKMVNRSNDQAMLKELSPDTKIVCIPDPTDITNPNLTNGATTIDSNDSAKFNNMPTGYPFVLQQRGFNGDQYGSVYGLADRKTGMSVRIGGEEVFILEAKATNDSSFVVENGPCTPNGTSGVNVTNYSINGNVVKVKMFYGQGNNSKNDIRKAYCLNMSSIISIDADTRLFYGGNISVTSTQNGSTFNYNMPLVGGKDINDTQNFNFKPMCWFSASSYFVSDSVNSSYGQTKFKTSSSYTGASSSYVDSGGNTHLVVGPQGTDVVDFCENAASYSSTLPVTYYLTFFSDYSFIDVTKFRSTKPIGIYSDTDKTTYYGIISNLGLIEANLKPTLTTLPVSTKLANMGASSFTNSVRILNLKHNSKYDPYCDDIDGDGVCNCKNSLGALVTNRECTLADEVLEPTMSFPPYRSDSSDGKKYVDFFNTFGGKSGANLSDATLLSTIDMKYLNDNKIYLDYQAIFKCAFKQGSNSEALSPNFFHSGKFSNTHFSGCPEADSAMPLPVITDNNNVGTSGGGPIRIIKPVPMNNAFDIARPRKLLNMIQYATKSVGQGVAIDPSKKVFSFDEALALVQVRYDLPPRDFKVRAGDASGSIANDLSFIFSPNGVCHNTPDIITSLLTVLVHPEKLNITEPDAATVGANCQN